MHRNEKVSGKRLGDYWLDHPKRRTYPSGVDFDPSSNPRSGILNLWQGFDTVPDPTQPCDLILEYLFDVVCGGDATSYAYLLTWLADIVQNPASKPGVAVVLRGLKGVGKDTLAEILRRIIGRNHTAHITNTARLGDRFNAPLATALLAHFEEASWGGDRTSKGTLQSLITAPTMPLEKKGVDVVQVRSFARLLLTSNEKWVVPTSADERRYFCMDVSDHRRGDRAYWNALYDQMHNGGLAGFHAYLAGWQTPEGLDLRDPPQTSALAAQKLAGLRGIDRWWRDILHTGELPGVETDYGVESDWEDDWQTVNKAALREDYEEWIRRKRWHGEALSPEEFTKAMVRLCPDCRVTKVGGRGKQVPSYKLPTLPECKALFEDAINIAEGDWDDD